MKAIRVPAPRAANTGSLVPAEEKRTALPNVAFPIRLLAPELLMDVNDPDAAVNAPIRFVVEVTLKLFSVASPLDESVKKLALPATESVPLRLRLEERGAKLAST